MEKKAEQAQEYLLYKGKPLVRCGNVLYYGNMSDKYVIKMEIKGTGKVGELEVANKVIIQLLNTDPTLRARKQIVKTSERDGLYAAMDIADAWLERALA